MKTPLRLLLFLLLFLSGTVTVFSQAPTVQDCLGAIPVCQPVYSTTNSYTGHGNVYPEIHANSSCPLCMAGEINDVFYTFTVQTSGILRFTLTPNNPNNDYDWSLFNMTHATCADIYTQATKLQVSCNSYGNNGVNGPTGISTALGNNSNCNGPGTGNGPAFNKDLPVTQGETYLLNISNWSSTNQSGYTLDFSNSTALIYDNIPPTIDSIQQTTTCAGLSSIYMRFSENVRCSDIQNHPEVFTITAATGSYTVTGLTNPDCAIGGSQTSYCILQVTPPLHGGDFDVNVVGPIEDLCGNLMLYQAYPIHVTELNGLTSNAGNDSTVNNGTILTLHGTTVGGTAPLSWHWEPAALLIDPNIQNPVTVNLTTTTTFTLTVTDAINCQSISTRTITVVGLPLAVTSKATPDTICTSSSTQLQALPVGGSGNYTYTWSSNPPGLTSNISNPVVSPMVTTVYSVQLNDGYSIVNASITVYVFPLDFVNISIAPSQNNICAGTQVTYTATPQNPGLTPLYQWQVNGISSGSNSTIFTYIPLDGDIVLCTLTSSITICTVGNPATSNTVTMVVNPLMPVSVLVVASQDTVCSNTLVTFTATGMHGGLTPQYQWQVNGVNSGTNSSTFTYPPLNNDVITCLYTSSILFCTSNNPATSNSKTMVVNPILPVSVSISVSQNPVCAGIPVTITALPGNPGTNPLYQWKVNNANAGTNSTTYTYVPVAGDQIQCILNSNAVCPSGNPATSNTINMTVPALPIVTFTSCFDTITTLNAKPIKLKGGIPLGGTYLGPGVNSGTSVFTPSAAGVGTKTIMYSYTNVASCSAAKTIYIHVFPKPTFVCGNPFLDKRDNRSYQTINIGTQCWMAEDLDYGTQIPYAEDQRDNCIAEKYHNPGSDAQHPASVYQWDELMEYDNIPAIKGLCPAGWHVPTENEWNTLFTTYINNGFAGNALKYSGYSGFNALLTGVNFFNQGWYFPTFATYYWSSTQGDSVKAWAHAMNDINPSVSFYPSSRANALSVRCIQD
jgi:uncharacterized protein (TIGR02145 family)